MPRHRAAPCLPRAIRAPFSERGGPYPSARCSRMPAKDAPGIGAPQETSAEAYRPTSIVPVPGEAPRSAGIEACQQPATHVPASARPGRTTALPATTACAGHGFRRCEASHGPRHGQTAAGTGAQAVGNAITRVGQLAWPDSGTRWFRSLPPAAVIPGRTPAGSAGGKQHETGSRIRQSAGRSVAWAPAVRLMNATGRDATVRSSEQ